MPTHALYALALAIYVMVSTPARADDDWHLIINFPMVWLPDISGEIITDGDKTSVDISIKDILEELSMGFIGEVYAYRGRWGLGWRTMYLATESDFSTEAITGLPGRPPIVGRHRVSVENELFTSDLLASYRVNPHFGLYTGVRRTGNRTDLNIKPLEEGLVELKGKYRVIDEELFDWVLGINLRHRLNQRWSVALQLDRGFAGDNDTNIQANGFFSYQFNERHGAWFGYRYLEIGNDDYEDGSRVESSFIQQGPTLGWAFSF